MDKLQKIPMIWAGTQYSAFLPKNFVGVIIYELPKVGVVVGFRLPFDLKDEIKNFVINFNGSFDGITSLWYAKPASQGLRECGKVINHFRTHPVFSQRFDVIEVAIESDMPQDWINNIRKWVKPQSNEGKIETICKELYKESISYKIDEGSFKVRFFVKPFISISDDEEYENPLSLDQIEVLESLGFQSVSKCWELEIVK
ncbi:MAG: hypothetical protein ACKPDM_29320 [Dolichospermum sp.]